MLRPETKKKMRGYLGLLNFYRKFLPVLAKHIQLLTNTLKKSLPDKINRIVDLEDFFELSKKSVCEHVELTTSSYWRLTPQMRALVQC